MEAGKGKTLHVTGLPASITVEDLTSFFTREFGPLKAMCRSSTGGITGFVHEDDQAPIAKFTSTPAMYGVLLHNSGVNRAAPWCYVTFSQDAPADLAEQAVMRCGADNRHLTVMEGWNSCVVRLQRQLKHHRLRVIQSNIAAKVDRQAARAARGPAWRPEMLDLFPCRESTLDQHAQVSELAPELQIIIATYLDHRFPDTTSEVATALKWVWQKYPKSLRVKELFETVEAFALIAQQLDLIRSRGQCGRSRTAAVVGRSRGKSSHKAVGDASDLVDADSGPVIDTIFDMACGHGLLGILLAYRFADVRVVCVDLQRREAFDHYAAAFKACGISDNASCEEEPLSNIEFIECDIANVMLPPRSFVVCVHACNEANKIVMDRAEKAQAGYAAMPCCIPDKLYSVQNVRYADKDMRYTAMVGVMAGTYGAHSIACIDRRITNRHMCIFGGYPFGGVLGGAEETLRTHRGRLHRSGEAC